MAVSDTLINTVFDGRYRVIRKLGAGGMADVYLAEDEELGRRVAIKILNERHANDEQFVERFRREAKNAAGLSHASIVSIYDRGEAEGTYYIAMEYLEGRTLKELIVRDGPLPIGDAIEYARQILAAVRFAHKKGIVHRDIKPHNVLIDGDGRAKVADFGIARAGASQMTEAGAIIGTAQYLSPEQARGAPVDERSDLYSVGVVLYELLTGSVPFSGESPVEIAMKHLSATPAPPSRKRADVPLDLDKLVVRALAKDPRDRFQSAEEMDAELGRVADGLPVSDETSDAATAVLTGMSRYDTAPTAVSRPRPMPYQPRPYYDYDEPAPRRRPFWPWLLALLLLVAAGIASWYAFDTLRDELRANEPVAITDLVGLEERLAVRQIVQRDLKPDVQRKPHDSVPEGEVYAQEPQAGERIERGNSVTILVSTGLPRTEVPDVVDKTRDEAIELIAAANLDPNPVTVPSEDEAGTVLAQSPKPGAKVREGTRVRINVSQGPQPIVVPDVVGELYEDALPSLQGAGFAVKRNDVASGTPEGTVVKQDPEGGSLQAEGVTVTLGVSKGPETVNVPDVTFLTEEQARQQLAAAGLKVRVRYEDTDDSVNDGLVLEQDPPGNTEAKPGSRVTVVVGRLRAAPPPVPPPTVPPPPVP